jgi:TIR domain/PAN domain
VTDIFFSYRSTDRERVRPIHDAFVQQGLEVFWDQEVPAGVDWDTWIRQHLARSKCAVVFWSASSVESDNVRHEATIAKRQNKLIQAMLEALTPDQIPLGLYTQQAINLAPWEGDPENAEWRKLRSAVEIKVTPPWMQRRIDELEAELVAERSRREGYENTDSALQAQIAKEVLAQQELRRERNNANEKAVTLAKMVDELRREKSEFERKAAQLSQRLATTEFQPSNSSRTDSKSQTIEKAQPQARNGHGGFVAGLVTMMLIFGISGLGVYFVWPGKPKVLVERLSFEIRDATEAFGDGTSIGTSVSEVSGADCVQKCLESSSCKIFTFQKSTRSCYLYSSASLKPNPLFETGIRK